MKLKRCTCLAISLIIAPVCSFGSTTICKIDSQDPLLPVAVSWDTSNNQAKASFTGYGQQLGKLTLSRKHNEDGNKVNLVFPSVKPVFGDEFEFIVFPTGPNKYRILGVTYIISGERKHLSFSLGAADGVCATL